MEIILKEDVINLGYKGDIVKVKDGYGRNFLIPTKKAVIASESAKKCWQKTTDNALINLNKSKITPLNSAKKLLHWAF